MLENRISETKVDLSLREHQGHFCVVERCLMIITEFINLYLDCMQVPQAHTYTSSAIVKLLLELHQSVGIKGKKELADYLARNITILKKLGLAVSKYRQCKIMCT